MKKRIIFDVDDTLIPWQASYFDDLFQILKQNNLRISRLRFLKVFWAITKYETTHERWNQSEFKKIVSQVSKIEVDDQKLEFFFTWLKNCVVTKAPSDLIDTLEYLSHKYQLVVLSNSITAVQKVRLKKYGILKYFKEIHGGDEHLKPVPQAYLNACGPFKPTECVMVGDNLKLDVKAPIKLGIKSIYVHPHQKAHYLTIKSVTELKDIL